MIDKKIQLNDISRPNLYRDVFPYTEFPKVSFESEPVQIDIPDDIWITDTTFRDGQQSRPPYTPEQILRIYDFLHEIDAGTGLIRQCEFFLYSNRDRKAVELCQARGYEFPQITGWIRATKHDFKYVTDAGLSETGILTSASDYHVFLKLRKVRSQAIQGYLDVVRSALDQGVVPRCHFEDITRADYEGFVLPFADELLDLAKEYDSPVKIRLCDTLGFGVPYPNASLPRSIPRLVQGLRQLGFPAEWLEWHGHNDFHKVQVNAATAWLYGCASANCSIFGVGERTGNPPLEAMIVEHAQIAGTNPKINYAAITELARYAQTELGFEISPNYPLVGKDFNVTRAGIHADGLLKNEEIYNCFDTSKLLDRPIGVAITDKTGAAGIKHYIESRYDISIAKHDPRVIEIKDRIDAEYEANRVSAISEDEMDEWIVQVFDGTLPPAK
ncbi:2-isopropylmalate synthase [Anaerohalosphaera lusitana]|uniref:2-isopropylmalate synthase n=1 Tax=Anaerohalosphaera lusitana TaxID=1936003 RepID=A0A1U9NHP6_9BACT|nr:2-isopropylmalate synthase [Anaerohalosphaera lusitana]AQT67036.1 2-isopropylmalate synthase [Anaerohalosphaera lusitana]